MLNKIGSFAVAALIAAASGVFATPVQAQCLVGCESSSSCGGSGRGSCAVYCDDGRCACVDSECSGGETAFAPRATEGSAQLAVFQGASVMKDCVGNTLDVKFSRRKARQAEAALASIALEPDPADRAKLASNVALRL